MNHFSAYVSILVFVELALGRKYFCGTWGRYNVSILVFVELALGPNTVRLKVSAGSGFNPCFRGTRPRTLSDRQSNLSHCIVSILVFVELALGRHVRSHCPHVRLVSILVFVELALGPLPDGYERY